VEFLSLGNGSGDGRLETLPQHAEKLAAIIRRIKPGLLLAPTPCENQHPDHAALSKLVRDAARLARYGGITALKKAGPRHAIDALLFYAITDADPLSQPLYIDISAPGIVDQWTRAMHAHASQMKTRNYVEYQLTRARLNGLKIGTQYAVALYPNDPLVFSDLNAIERTARAY
jgi:N-acetylglucosamine malate deacetylase 1